MYLQWVIISRVHQFPATAPSRSHETRSVYKARQDGSVEHTLPQHSFSTVLQGHHVQCPSLVPGGEASPRALDMGQ